MEEIKTWQEMFELMKERPSPFYKILLKAAETHYRKNKNYASEADPFSNFKQCEAFGIPAEKGVLVRMSDKWSRIINLSGGVEDLVGESLKDTILDLGVYSLILYAMMKEKEAKYTK
jgi:hypothetical protein